MDKIEPTLLKALGEENKEPPKKLRKCSHCGSVIEVKSPWAALWRMPTLNEWITLFMIVMILFTAWAYNHDISICRNYIKNIDSICLKRNELKTINYTASDLSSLNNITVFNGTYQINQTKQIPQ